MDLTRRAVGRDDTERNEAIRRSWSLLNSYGTDMSHSSEEPNPDTSRAIEIADSAHDETELLDDIGATQGAIIQCVESGMMAWLSYYFALTAEPIDHRLQEAATGLSLASRTLLELNRQMRSLAKGLREKSPAILDYIEALDGWAESFEMIAHGTRLRSGTRANEGITQMDLVTECLKPVVDLEEVNDYPSRLASALVKLAELEPQGDVKAAAIQAAKAPWVRVLVASGSAII